MPSIRRPCRWDARERAHLSLRGRPPLMCRAGRSPRHRAPARSRHVGAYARCEDRCGWLCPYGGYPRSRGRRPYFGARTRRDRTGYGHDRRAHRAKRQRAHAHGCARRALRPRRRHHIPRARAFRASPARDGYRRSIAKLFTAARIRSGCSHHMQYAKHPLWAIPYTRRTGRRMRAHSWGSSGNSSTRSGFGSPTPRPPRSSSSPITCRATLTKRFAAWAIEAVA